MEIPDLPTPFPIPTPDPLNSLDVSALWDYQNVGGLLSALQSVIVLANQNRILSAFVALGLIALLIWVVMRVVSSRGTPAGDNI